MISRSSSSLPPSVQRQTNDVARRERELARRQREVRALAARPQILQPDVGAPLGRGVIGHDREIGMRDPRRAADQPARRDGRAAIIACRSR